LASQKPRKEKDTPKKKRISPPLCFESDSVLKTNVNVNANVNVKIDKPHAASQLNANVSVCVPWSEGRTEKTGGTDQKSVALAKNAKTPAQQK